MSKVSFRARQIDFNKPLPILTFDSELFSEISENALVNRGVPQIPSGMEKDEENEHHFLEVLQALQNHKSEDVIIPVPEIVDQYASHAVLYPNGYVPPKQFIHIRTIVLAEEEPIEYDMDTEDEEWLRKSDLAVSPDKFEAMIDKLERGCGQKVMNLEEAKCLLQDDPALVIAVYDYWLNKRVQSRQPLLLSVRQERRDGGSNNDPYVAFRRRTERMQTRKNRKNDEQSYEKMLILREQMNVLGEIVSRLVKRETTKGLLVQNEKDVFNIRYLASDWDASKLAEANLLARRCQKFSVDSTSNSRVSKDTPRKRSNRKRKLSRRPHGCPRGISSDEATDVDLEEDHTSKSLPFAFIRTPGCKYLKPSTDVMPDPRILDNRLYNLTCYRLTSVPVHHQQQHVYTGYIRRRLGRGGRVVFDRVACPPSIQAYLAAYDDALGHFVPDTDDHYTDEELDPVIDPLWRVSSQLRSCIASLHPGRLSRTSHLVLSEEMDHSQTSRPLPPHSTSFCKASPMPLLNCDGLQTRISAHRYSHSSGNESTQSPPDTYLATASADNPLTSNVIPTEALLGKFLEQDSHNYKSLIGLEGANSRFVDEVNATTLPAHTSVSWIDGYLAAQLILCACQQASLALLSRAHGGFPGYSSQTRVVDDDCAKQLPHGAPNGLQRSWPAVRTKGLDVGAMHLACSQASETTDGLNERKELFCCPNQSYSLPPVSPSMDNGIPAAALKPGHWPSSRHQRLNHPADGSMDCSVLASSAASTTGAPGTAGKDLRPTSGGLSPTQVC
ncbi:unnamed protein product [Protopolystoma xenopodis]|uniref:Enhancer of polycomb-like protein n=1 Tax=Protopolystoma xenopodis TaxID=117903 RepID=A0A448WA50_9PLAT|nr:unnamed protein product [Protopolystoma xenopodis]